MEPIRVVTTLAGRELVLETGALAILSAGAVTVRYGDTVILSTCNISKEASRMSYFPMMVEYREKFSTGYKLANDGHDTRAIQHYLGHKNIQHTVRYTELSAARFKDFWQD